MKFAHLFDDLHVQEFFVAFPCEVVSFVKESYFVYKSVLSSKDNQAFECNCY